MTTPRTPNATAMSHLPRAAALLLTLALAACGGGADDADYPACTGALSAPPAGMQAIPAAPCGLATR